MKIFLTGYMASGKTSLGKPLAHRLNYSFQDLDKMIESTASLTIDEIFSLRGESFFRKLETEALHSLGNAQNMVISTGGGTPCFYDNMAWMNRNGITIYISMKPEIIHHRLLNSKTKRPLVENKNPDELLSFIVQQIKEREEFYRLSAIIVDGMGLNPDKLLDILNQHIREQ